MRRKLGRKADYRKMMLRNLSTSLILYEKIYTTEAKAKETKSKVEKLLSVAKSNNLQARRAVAAYLLDKNASKKVFEVLIPRYTKRNTGFIESYHLDSRIGDGSRMMLLRLIREQNKELKEINTSKSGEKYEKKTSKTSKE